MTHSDGGVSIGHSSVYPESVSRQRPALSLEWIDAIHSKLTLVYGGRFAAMYAGLSIDVVRGDWAHELAGMSWESLTWGLTHLPADFPPNVLQFRALCIRTPDRGGLALPAPKASPERVARVLAALAPLRGASRPKADPKAWADRLRKREQLGERLSSTQRAMWRAAIQPAQPLAAEAVE